MEQTNIIKLKFLRSGVPSGREYTYFTPEPVEVGDKVDIAIVSEGTTSQGQITQVNVPYEEIEPFKDRAKTIIGKAKEDQAGEGNEAAIKMLHPAQETSEKTLLDV